MPPQRDKAIPELVTLAGAARLLGVSKQAAHKLVRTGRLPAVQPDGGGGWLLRREVVTRAAGAMSVESVLPEWLLPRDGSRELVSEHVLAGYGSVMGEDEESARAAWLEVSGLVSRIPAAALVLGASMSSVLLGPLDRHPFVVLVTGQPGSGKSALARSAAAVVGDPDLLVRPVGQATVAGVRRSVAGLAMLPAFREGLDGTANKFAETVFSMFAGQTMASRSGSTTVASPWCGVLIGTAERGLNSHSHLGVAARVVELEAPSDARADTMRLAQLMSGAHGWPLRWLNEYGPGALSAADRADTRGRLLNGVSVVGVAERLAEHLVTAVQGADMLDHMIGPASTLGAMARAAAHEILVAEAGRSCG